MNNEYSLEEIIIHTGDIVIEFRHMEKGFIKRVTIEISDGFIGDITTEKMQDN
jgi:hypothetical protein